MNLLDWTFNFFADERLTQISLMFAFLDLLLASFFRIAFNGFLRFRVRMITRRGDK